MTISSLRFNFDMIARLRNTAPVNVKVKLPPEARITLPIKPTPVAAPKPIAEKITPVVTTRVTPPTTAVEVKLGDDTRSTDPITLDRVVNELV